jgi:tripartite-type tricarboxylate transporter receptor subunit TctC
MNISMKKLFLLLFLVVTNHSFANTWPTRPVKFIVSGQAGGSVDTVIRIIQKSLTDELGQQLIVEYKPGANGKIAAAHVANIHDDHTVLLTAGELAINSIITPNGSHNIKNFKPVTIIAKSPTVLISKNKNLVQDILEARDLNYGYAGNSTSYLLLRHLKPTWTAVPYAGAPAMLLGVASGTVDIGIASISAAMTMINAGKMYPILVFGDSRLAMFPNVPSSQELKINLDGSVWFAAYMADSTDDTIIKNLYSAIDRVFRKPEIISEMSQHGYYTVSKDPVEAMTFIDNDTKQWINLGISND